MKTTLRIGGKRYHIDIPEKERFAMQRMKERLNFKSINGLVTWLLIKYEDDREFVQDFPEYVRYCIRREMKNA